MIIKQALVFLNGQFTKTDVRVENGVIAEVGTLEATGDVADGEGKLLLPGLLEIHSTAVWAKIFPHRTKKVWKRCAAITSKTASPRYLPPR